MKPRAHRQMHYYMQMECAKPNNSTAAQLKQTACIKHADVCIARRGLHKHESADVLIH